MSFAKKLFKFKNTLQKLKIYNNLIVIKNLEYHNIDNKIKVVTM
jgi:hypothetical protein